jgi:hypothetical protein
VTEAHGPGNLSGPSSGQLRHPSGETPLRSRGPVPYHRNSASLEGWTPPRAKLRLTRGLDAPSGETPPRSRAGRPLGRDSASLEGWTPPRVRLRLAQGLCTPSGGSLSRLRLLRVHHSRTHSPDRSIKCSDATRAPGSKANPRHAGPLTPPGNHIPALFHHRPCAAIPATVRHCAVRLVSAL